MSRTQHQRTGTDGNNELNLKAEGNEERGDQCSWTLALGIGLNAAYIYFTISVLVKRKYRWIPLKLLLYGASLDLSNIPSLSLLLAFAHSVPLSTMQPFLCVAHSCSPSAKKDWTSLLQGSLLPSPDLVKISHSAFLWCPVIFLQKNSSLIVQYLLPYQMWSSRATTFAYCSPQHRADRPWERYNRWATHICQREGKLGSVNYIRAHHNSPRARPGCKPLRSSGGTGNCCGQGPYALHCRCLKYF